MLKARLDRLEAAEYAALLTTMDGDHTLDEASAYIATAPNLANLEKTERFLRRNYMQTWSRLERMQRDRKADERMQRERKNEEREYQQAATDAQPQTIDEAGNVAATKQTQHSATQSKHAPTSDLSAHVQASSPANHPIDETTANAA